MRYTWNFHVVMGNCFLEIEAKTSPVVIENVFMPEVYHRSIQTSNASGYWGLSLRGKAPGA
jgi:hypothetical protein